MWPLDSYKSEHNQDAQLRGLRESVSYLHDLLEDAVKEVRAENVILIGLNQGCAVSLLALLLWYGEALGGFVGMCGWLPLRRSMLQVLTEEDDVDSGDDVFERDEDDYGQSEEKSEFEKVSDFFREELNTPGQSPVEQSEKAEPGLKTLVFLAHGTEDEKVPFGLGRLASQFLADIRADVTWREHKGLRHWYSAYMLSDVVQFLDDVGEIS